MSKENHNAKKAAAAMLNQMSKANGGKITPQQIVDAARNEDSPLHRFFEWDDDKAAEQYRLDQARTLLRSCQVEVTVSDRKVQVPYYVRDPEADTMDQGYVESGRLKTQEDLSREVLLTEFQRAGSQLARARRLAAYFGAVEEVDSLIEQIGLLKTRIEGDSPQMSA